MIKLEPNEIKFIKENFKNADALLASDDVNDILDEIDAIITYKGFDDNYDLNDFGDKAQHIYDSIYLNN